MKRRKENGEHVGLSVEQISIGREKAGGQGNQKERVKGQFGCLRMSNNYVGGNEFLLFLSERKRESKKKKSKQKREYNKKVQKQKLNQNLKD